MTVAEAWMSTAVVFGLAAGVAIFITCYAADRGEEEAGKWAGIALAVLTVATVGCTLAAIWTGVTW